MEKMTKIPRPTGNKEGEFISKLFYIRDVVHITHLYQKSKSFAIHNALNILYDNILDLIDDVAETYQGIHNQVEVEILSGKRAENPIAFIQEHYDYIQANRSIFVESFIQNIIDEISQELAHAMYRLKFVQ